MPIEFSFTATPDLGPKALRFLLRRRAGVFGPAALILFPILLAVLALDPAMRPAAYVLGGAVIMLLVIFLAAVAHLRRLRRRFFDTTQDRTIRIAMDDEGVAVTSALGATKLAWPSFERLWVGDEVVLLFYHGWQRLAFPRDAVPQAALDLVDARLKERDRR
jgi:hypothetical protein